MSAKAKISALSSLMKAKKEAGKPFVLMLGAGASFSSGVVSTDRLMKEIVERYGPHIPGPDIGDRFSELWAKSSPDDREIFLKPYLDRKPSRGYAQLAELMRQGFIREIITFNFDNLVEAALIEAGLREPFDYKVIVRGDHADDKVVSMMAAREPAIKVLKLHGSLRGANTFLFSQEEMSGYPEEIEALVQRLTGANVIVCGYGFADICVVRAFSNTGESIHCVNPSGAPMNLKSFLRRRQSSDNTVDGEDGRFDEFFQQLRDELSKVPLPPGPKPKSNPFKFLDSYESCDRQLLFGRRALARQLIARIDERPAGGGATVVPVVGKAKVGKTSFLRAGLLPYLDRARYHPVYVRCTRGLQGSLPGALCLDDTAAGDLAAALRALAASVPDRRVVLVLDQFERVLPRFRDERDLAPCLKSLCGAAADNLSIVLVGETDPSLLLCLNMLGIRCLVVPPLEPRAVSRIVRMLAQSAGTQFDPAVVEAIGTRYSESRFDSKKTPFTLAHVQAVCSLMMADAAAGRRGLDLVALEEALKSHLDSLNRAINEFDILSVVEDFPFEELRAVVCGILRSVPEPGRTQIFDYLWDNRERMCRPRPPQPPSVAAAGRI
jgi:hypothetical protein